MILCVMKRRTTGSTRTDTLFAHTTRFRSQRDILDLRFRGSDLADIAAADGSLQRLREAGAQGELLDIGGRHLIGLADVERPPVFGLAGRVIEADPHFGRSEERRVGKGCVSTCRSRWSPYP